MMRSVLCKRDLLVAKLNGWPKVARLKPSTAVRGAPSIWFGPDLAEAPHGLATVATADCPLWYASTAHDYFALRVPLLKAGFLRVLPSDSQRFPQLLLRSSFRTSASLTAVTTSKPVQRQHLNHFPGSFPAIGNKGGLRDTLASAGCLDFHPETLVLPREWRLAHDWAVRCRNQERPSFILKPSTGSCGRGIRVLTAQDLRRVAQQAREGSVHDVVVQRYLEPFLLAGRKFDMRLYVLVTGVDPVRIYLHTEGLVRFSSRAYAEHAEERCVHLTNYSVNRHVQPETGNPITRLFDRHDGTGLKCHVSDVMRKLAEEGVDVANLQRQIGQIVTSTILAAAPVVRRSVANLAPHHQNSCYEIFGFDILLDADAQPWLLEVNTSPSMEGQISDLDYSVKTSVVTDTYNMLLIQPQLVEAEPTLPSDAQRVADERRYSGGFKPLFPVCQSSELVRPAGFAASKRDTELWKLLESAADGSLPVATPIAAHRPQ